MMRHKEIYETLLKHSQIANQQAGIAEQHTDILLQLTNSYFELLEKVGQQKSVISAQGNLINQCMERVMELEKTNDTNMGTIQIMLDCIKQLEGRSILANFNQRIECIESRLVSTPSTHELGDLEVRLETLEANQGKFYGLNDRMTIRQQKQLIERVDNLESWLYTHDYAYFQEQEENKFPSCYFQEEEEKQSDNSSFEEYEIAHPDPSYIEREDVP